MKEKTVVCPKCNEKWYSEFDKAFVKIWGECVFCADESKVENMGEVVFESIKEE
jgi:hypothetical protein